MIDNSLVADERAFLERVRVFACDRVAPFTEGWERRREFPLEAFRAGALLGLSALLIPKEFGGLGFSHVLMARALEEMAKASFAFSFTLFVQHNVIASIAKHGTRTQIDRFLAPMRRGERVGAFCLTEPGAGSDAAAIATRAVKHDGGWELNGDKAWITNGAVADVYSVYAQTDPTLGEVPLFSCLGAIALVFWILYLSPATK